MDGGLKSFATPDSGISVIQSTQAMCATVNLRLHKFASGITLPAQTTWPTLPQEAPVLSNLLNVKFGSKALAFYGIAM